MFVGNIVILIVLYYNKYIMLRLPNQYKQKKSYGMPCLWFYDETVRKRIYKGKGYSVFSFKWCTVKKTYFANERF